MRSRDLKTADSYRNLSEHTFTGMPYLAKIVLVASMTGFEEVPSSSSTSGNFNRASYTRKYELPATLENVCVDPLPGLVWNRAHHQRLSSLVACVFSAHWTHLEERFYV